MSAQHTPMRQGFNTGKHVFVPDCAKPINAGTKDCAAFIVRACNAHDELVASAKAFVEPPLRIVGATIEIDCSDHLAALALVARLRDALAKAGAA